MTIFVLCIAAIIVTEMAIRFRLGQHFHRLSITTHEICFVLGSKHISDHWKERVLLNYASTLALNSIKLGAIFLLLLLSFVLISGLLSPLSLEQTLDLSMTLQGLLSVVISSLFFYILRNNLGRK